MATPSDARAVKSLNKSSGRRFVFKTFSQRIEEIDIDVYRTLDPLKAEPSEGSSFFRDTLVEYRELNTAEDFTSIYEEVFPLVQTLPQIILQKDFIISNLLSRLKMEGRLSHEPILRLIAALARDLLGDFIPFLPRIADSLESLLQSGADRDPEIIEQIFTSWSYIMMYLQKYLTEDVGHVLRITANLRYYPKDYVREFMAESVSFLLRKTPVQQLKKGITKLMAEVVEEPSEMRKSGVGALLSHVMRITSSRLHSKTETLLPLLVDDLFFQVGDESVEGSRAVLEVLILALRDYSVASGNSVHLGRLLALLISVVQNDYLGKISDYEAMVELVGLLVPTFVIPHLTMKIVDTHPEMQANPSLLMDLINATNELLMVGSSFRESTWHSLIGAALRAYRKLVFSRNIVREESAMTRFLDLAKRYKLSPKILSAVADILDSISMSSNPPDRKCQYYLPEYIAGMVLDALDIFAENLCHANKEIRLSTLRILCHYEPIYYERSRKELPTEDNNVSEISHVDDPNNVLNLLRSIEETALSISTSPSTHQSGGGGNDSNKDSGLVGCFNSDIFTSFDSTPCATVLSLLIQTLQRVPSIMESHSRQIVPLFLKFLGYNVDEIIWLLDQNDADLQMMVLDCLLNWRDDFLLPYSENLRNLINAKCLREELTRWNLSRTSIDSIDVRHGAYVVPIVIRILIPKVRNLKTLGCQKNASVHHRRAVLGFLAQLDVDELPIFFWLLLKPLLSVSQSDDETSKSFWSLPQSHKDEIDTSEISKHFTTDTINALSWKKRYGFLHVVEDILTVFDESHLNPFLNLLMQFVVRILASCTSSSIQNCSSFDLDVAGHDEVGDKITERMAVKQFKDVRSLCLKIIYRVLSKYEDHEFGGSFWDLFFTSIKPLIANFKQEGASSKKPSSLFYCFLAMSKNYKLVPLLDREGSLIPDIFSILTVPSASESILSCVLKFTKNLLKLDSELGSEDIRVKRILLPHLDVLICSLHSIFTNGVAAKRQLVKFPGKREFTIFNLLSKYIQEASAAKSFIDILLPLLTKRHLNFADLAVRNSICDVLDAVSANDSSVLILAKILRELNATSEVEMGALDYDKVLCAYDKMILRQSALRLLLSFIEFSGEILNGSLKSNHIWSEASIQRIVNNFFLKHMGNAMDKEGAVKRPFYVSVPATTSDAGCSFFEVWIDLLREMVLKLPSVANLDSYRALCCEDAEQDFFSNIVHLQKHRRARAVSRFAIIVNSGNMSEVITNKVIVPLLFSMLLDAQDGKDEHIRSACLDALASISGCMKWDRYYALLLRCFRDLTLKPEKQKLLLRLICSILDHFHFSEPSLVYEAKVSGCDALDPYTIDITSSSALRKCTSSVGLPDIRTCLHKKFFPKIQKLLTSNSDNVNVKISLVALKLLKLLPGEIMDSQLLTIVHRISNFLKSGLQSVRDEARSALAVCLKELGLEYLQFIVKVLKGTLKRGYELHVLGYTLNFLLSKFLTSPISGKLDYCLDDLLSVVVNDILGDVSEEKEVDKIASKMKETRKQKSYETLKLIARSITFKTHALKLLSPVAVHLHNQLTQKVKLKLENMLNHIAAGIECNPSVNQTELFIFANCLIKDELHENLKLNRDDELLLSLLDPFVGLLGQCLSSKYENVIIAALRCLVLLVRLPLPSLQSEADKIKNSLLVIAQGSFLLGYHLSEKRLQQHLDFLLANLRYEHSTGREAVLEMLHAIILKFPRNVVDGQSQTVFLHLVVSLANDDDSKVRSMAAAAIKCLIGHVSSHSLHSILEYSLSWYIGENRICGLLQHRSVIEVLGLLVEVMGKSFEKHLDRVLPVMRSVFRSAVSALTSSQRYLSNEAVPFWKEAYYSLVMLEKILNRFRNLFFDRDLEDIWEIICEFLLHPHLWLRNISDRVLSQYFTAVTDACRDNKLSMETFFLMKPSILFLVAVSSCCQLKVPLITDDAAGIIVLQNLVFSICGLHSVLEKNECMDVSKFWSNLDRAEQDRFHKAFGVLDPRKGRRTLASLTCDAVSQHDKHQHPFITYLLQRMGKIAFQMEVTQMKIVFNCFKSISPKLLDRYKTLSSIGNDDFHSYAYQMLLPLYRVCEGYTGQVISGVQNFVQVYSQIRKNLKAKRDKKKQVEKIMAVVNPTRNAKRKLRVAEKHRAHKKRKIMAMKMGRWTR
ncbi:hypothetical protein DH2020_048703 [Rehmannia glutinosa]|uniref:Small subunit processome component 20-like protein n=1 Tax=Rehmannia glutinosa TaxID=99300 RepID=A0ABR0U4V2_REHGL